MKKLILLLFIPLVSFGQIIENDRYIKKSTKTLDGETVVVRAIDISEIEDEFIKVVLGKYSSSINPTPHLLSTSKYKNIQMWNTSNSKRWNVYDGENLIQLKDEVDVLNFFSKYGFEFFKTTNWADNYSTRGEAYTLIFRNNNN